MRVLPDFVPPGERVLNDRGDGSAWMYAIAGVLPVAGHYNAGQIGPDADLLAGRFNEYPNDPAVRAAVARLGVNYVMVDRGFVRAGYSGSADSAPVAAELAGAGLPNPDAEIYRIARDAGTRTAGGSARLSCPAMAGKLRLLTADPPTSPPIRRCIEPADPAGPGADVRRWGADRLPAAAEALAAIGAALLSVQLVPLHRGRSD